MNFSHKNLIYYCKTIKQTTNNMEKITKDQFSEYCNWQNLGYFNMLDYNSWSNFTSLTKDQWFTIIKNYSALKTKFND